jgi:hypothetical protein
MTGSMAARRLRRHAPLLARGVDPELVIGRGVVAAVAGVGEDALQPVADERFHIGDHACESVPVIGVAWQRRDMGDKLDTSKNPGRIGEGLIHSVRLKTEGLAWLGNLAFLILTSGCASSRRRATIWSG